MKSIKITPQIQKILDYFITSSSVKDDYLFPFLPKEITKLDQSGMNFKKIINAKTALLNKYLKEIGNIANIDKKITNHIARHSFANVARKKTNDVHSIKSALGHSSVKITEMYLDSFDEEGLDSMMNNVFN
jgi:integrase